MREMFLGCVVFLAASAGAEPPLTVVESTGYLRTSMYAEVVTFVHEVASTSQVVSLATLTTSTEGRPVPLVILAREQVRTPAELRAAGKPAVLIMANIHAGEVEGKEACQMLIRDVAGGTLARSARPPGGAGHPRSSTPTATTSWATTGVTTAPSSPACATTGRISTSTATTPSSSRQRCGRWWACSPTGTRFWWWTCTPPTAPTIRSR